MTIYHTFIDDTIGDGPATIAGIQENASAYGIGVTSGYKDIIADNITVGVITATTFSGDGSGLTGIVGSGSGVIVQDDGSLRGTAGTINFGANLDVTEISSGVVTVTATSSGVGIGTTGSVNTTGIITASQFYGVGLPQNLQSNAYILTNSDAGKHVAISTGGITLNSSIFDVGDVVTIYNDSEYSQGITVGSGVTMRRVSIGDTGNRGLNAYGLATILCIGTNSYIISGAGVT